MNAKDAFSRSEAALEYRPTPTLDGQFSWYWILLALPHQTHLGSGTAPTRAAASVKARQKARQLGRKITKIHIAGSQEATPVAESTTARDFILSQGMPEQPEVEKTLVQMGYNLTHRARQKTIVTYQKDFGGGSFHVGMTRTFLDDTHPIWAFDVIQFERLNLHVHAGIRQGSLIEFLREFEAEGARTGDYLAAAEAARKKYEEPVTEAKVRKICSMCQADLGEVEFGDTRPEFLGQPTHGLCSACKAKLMAKPGQPPPQAESIDARDFILQSTSWQERLEKMTEQGTRGNRLLYQAGAADGTSPSVYWLYKLWPDKLRAISLTIKVFNNRRQPNGTITQVALSYLRRPDHALASIQNALPTETAWSDDEHWYGDMNLFVEKLEPIWQKTVQWPISPGTTVIQQLYHPFFVWMYKNPGDVVV